MQLCLFAISRNRVTEPIDSIALWLGREGPTTTHRYTEANLAMLAKALARMTGCGATNS